MTPRVAQVLAPAGAPAGPPIASSPDGRWQFGPRHHAGKPPPAVSIEGSIINSRVRKSSASRFNGKTALAASSAADSRDPGLTFLALSKRTIEPSCHFEAAPYV